MSANQALFFNPTPSTSEAGGDGLWICRMTTARRVALGLTLNSTTDKLRIVGDTDTGNYYFWNGTAWVDINTAIVSIIDFGGDPTGVADSSAAFTAAFAALAAGGTLYIPTGTFLCSNVTLPPAITILGDGITSIIKGTSATLPIFRGATATPLTGVKLYNLAFTTSLTLVYGDPNVERAAAVFLETASTTFLEMVNCRITNLFAAVSDNGVSNSGIRIINCQAAALLGSLIRVYNANTCKIIGNTLNGDRTAFVGSNNTILGIWFGDTGETASTDSGYDIVIDDNTVFNTYGEGIACRCAFGSVTGNRVSNATNGASGSYGIIVEGTGGASGIPHEFGFGAGNYTVVHGNRVYTCDGGIRVSVDPANVNNTPRDVIITGNLVYNINGTNQKGIAAGFSAAQVSLRCKISDNKVFSIVGTGNADAIYLLNASNAQVEGNLLDTFTRYGIMVDTSNTAANLCNDSSVKANTIVSTLAGTQGIFVFPRFAGAINRLVVDGNTVQFKTVNGRGVDTDSATVGGMVDCVFTNNTIIGDSTLNAAGLRLTGTTLTVSNNVGVNMINRQVVLYQGTYSFSTRTLNDANGRQVRFGTAIETSSATNTLQGDIEWNSAPDDGEVAGWLATVAGLPGTWRGFGYVTPHASATTAKTINSAAADVSLVNTVIGSKITRASEWFAGRVFRIKAKGYYTTGATSTGTVSVKIGALVIATTGAVAFPVSQTDMGFDLEFDIVCNTIGAGGTLIGEGRLILMQSTGVPLIYGLVATATTAIDTTVVNTFDAFLNWADVAEGETLTTQAFTLSDAR